MASVICVLPRSSTSSFFSPRELAAAACLQVAAVPRGRRGPVVAERVGSEVESALR